MFGGGHFFLGGAALEHGWSFIRFPLFSITFLVDEKPPEFFMGGYIDSTRFFLGGVTNNNISRS